MSTSSSLDIGSAWITPAAPQVDRGLFMGTYRTWITDPNGRVLYDEFCKNSLTTTMCQRIANMLSFQATSVPSGAAANQIFSQKPYVGLTTATAGITSTISGVGALATAGTEATGNGYTAITGRLAPTTWTYVAGPPAGFNNTANAVSWTASGGNLGGAAITGLFLTPCNSATPVATDQVVISFAALNGGSQTVATGNTLNVTYSWTVS